MGTRRKGYVGEFKLPTRVWLTRMRDVAAKPIQWLWPERLPFGKVTLLVGDPGRGKSLLALDMAARVTRGAPWPGQGVSSSEFRVSGSEGEAAASGPETTNAKRETRDAKRETGNPVGSVVVLSAEDDVADTIRPRFEAAGGDVDRVAVLRAVRRPGEAEGDPAVPVLAWEPEPVALTAEEGLGVGVGRPSRRETAARWLEGLLSRGPMAVTDVERMALAAGISGMTLRRARHSLGVVSFHDAPKAPWLLSLRRDEVKEGPVDGTAVECIAT